MQSEREISSDADENGVPIENAGVCAETKIGPQGLEEISLRVQRNTADDVAEGGAKKDGQQRARETERQIEERRPHGACNEAAKFDGDATQNQEPENDHQRQ